MARLTGGRPSKLTKRTIETLETAFTIGATYEIAARSAGLSPRVLFKWKNEADAVLTRLDEEQDKADARDKEILLAQARGEAPPEPYTPDLKITSRERLLIQFLQSVREAEALGAMQHLDYLQRAAPGNPQISQWMLMNRHGYGREPTRVEVSGPKGGPIETKGDVDVETVANRISQLLAVAAQRKTSEAPDVSGDE